MTRVQLALLGALSLSALVAGVGAIAPISRALETRSASRLGSELGGRSGAEPTPSSSSTPAARARAAFSRPLAKNRLAYVPPQCFTRTQDRAGGGVHNPCYVCHDDGREPNYQSEAQLQLSYDFPAVQAGHGALNHWSNLFRDRRAAIREIPDRELDTYVSEDNYRDLRGRLAAAPAEWDTNGNGRWDGYLPDAYFRFDAQGFDRDVEGQSSGFRAFAYYPVPGAFMPTNGSFDDVLIRLPAAFREDGAGRPDDAVYDLNLSIVEVLIRRADVPISATDERALGVDLDADGVLGTAHAVRFRWDPLKGKSMSYVGRARNELDAKQVHLAAGLFPEGTEFLHSVRYLAVAEQGKVLAAPRMKELRYARKTRWVAYAELAGRAQREAKEEALNPDRPDRFLGDAERGLYSGSGWTYQGFIEDAAGRLRPQNYEETLFCIGCHSRLGVTTDSTFAFSRKITDSVRRGYYHFTTAPDAPLPDPARRDGKLEYSTYLENNPYGDAFRSNQEVFQKFFEPSGEPRAQAFERLREDIRTLLLPSAERARSLDKAYWLIVREQSFARGREPVTSPVANVWQEIEPGTPTGVARPFANPGLMASSDAPGLDELGLARKVPGER